LTDFIVSAFAVDEKRLQIGDILREQKSVRATRRERGGERKETNRKGEQGMR
jgi:hypothetical protein